MILKNSLKILAKSLLKVDDRKQMEGVLEDLLTPQEIVDLADRVRILAEIKTGKTQREVAEELGISVTTVNRGSRVLKFGSGEIKKIV